MPLVNPSARKTMSNFAASAIWDTRLSKSKFSLPASA